MTPADAAATLVRARIERRAVLPFTDEDPTLDEAWGYAVQDLDRLARLAAGERVVGAKLGLTSAPKQQRMGIARPIAGFLTDAHVIEGGGGLPVHRWIQPRAEPEIAFLLGHDLVGPVDRAGAAAVLDGVAIAVELIDSRFEGYRFRLADVLADETSAAGFAVGAWVEPDEAGDLAAVTCEVWVDGQRRDAATGAAILGHPLEALVWLSEHLASRGETLPAGSVVLAGAMTDAIPLADLTSYEVRSSLGTLELTT